MAWRTRPLYQLDRNRFGYRFVLLAGESSSSMERRRGGGSKSGILGIGLFNSTLSIRLVIGILAQRNIDLFTTRGSFNGKCHTGKSHTGRDQSELH